MYDMIGEIYLLRAFSLSLSGLHPDMNSVIFVHHFAHLTINGIRKFLFLRNLLVIKSSLVDAYSIV